MTTHNTMTPTEAGARSAWWVGNLDVWRGVLGRAFAGLSRKNPEIEPWLVWNELGRRQREAPDLMGVLVAVADNHAIGVAVLDATLVDGNGERFCQWWLGWCEPGRMAEAWAIGWPEILAWAKERGCASVQVETLRTGLGRRGRGMGRLLARHGFAVHSVSYRTSTGDTQHGRIIQ